VERETGAQSSYESYAAGGKCVYETYSVEERVFVCTGMVHSKFEVKQPEKNRYYCSESLHAVYEVPPNDAMLESGV